MDYEGKQIDYEGKLIDYKGKQSACVESFFWHAETQRVGSCASSMQRRELYKRRAVGLRSNGGLKNECRFRFIRPSRRDDPSHRGVPDGNSENSVLSVLKINYARGDGYFRRVEFGTRSDGSVQNHGML